ncbi:hypothetical protein PMW_06 [Pseudomonas phage phiPMW]|uniref:Uncharacterized protein n=1 Tax=Pseudomonas phage phiPMW TaxID=1815582 RepID=A0A1S5R141_9CAUD|nr:hypothetical protein FDG97_gp006 [Pseudomonas phage phiPMW]ANA49131.1 hypothetical protein PMW_06 [Pseudomonas phage phiPMW]
MSAFKEGQRVVVIGSSKGFNDSSVGKHGVIAIIDNSNLPVLVRFDDDDSDWGCFEEIMLEMSADEAMQHLAKAALALSRAQDEYDEALKIAKKVC